jgi:hypothetical protein
MPIEEDDAAMPDITEFSKDARADVAHQIFHLQKRKNFDVKAKTCGLWPEMCEIAIDPFEQLSQIDSPYQFEYFAIELESLHPLSRSIPITRYAHIAITSRVWPILRN